MFATILAVTNGAAADLTSLGGGVGGAILIMAGKWAFTKARGTNGTGRYPCAQHGERLATQETALDALTKLLDERTQRIERTLTDIGNKIEKGVTCPPKQQ